MLAQSIAGPELGTAQHQLKTNIFGHILCTLFVGGKAIIIILAKIEPEICTQ